VCLPQKAKVTLKVYDPSGRLVRTLVEGRLGKGYHTFNWNGTDARGRSVAAGMYVYRLFTGKQTLVKKTVFAK
jgi:flagellar hook assembly protein FlgD